MYRKTFSILLILAMMLAACGSQPSGIQRVTPLPSQDASLTNIIASPTLLQPSPTLQATQEATVRAATSMPLSNNLIEGEARVIAAATDTALQPTPRLKLEFDAEPVSIRFDEFYDGFNLRTGLTLSDKLVSLDGLMVEMQGYMAPPLKPELDYFVLTRVHLAFCPFCTTAGDWPDDIALVYMPEGVTTIATDRPVRVVGRMEIGQSVDQETGMVSLVRLYAESLESIG